MNGKQARRHRAAERAHLEASLDQARQATPEHVATLPGGAEVWTVGPIACVIPPLLDDMPTPVKNAVDRRRRATLTGRCDCGAERRWTAPRHMTLDHTRDCPAGDANLVELGARHGYVFARHA